jgi:integrase
MQPFGPGNNSAMHQNAPWLQTTAGNRITAETPFSEAADLWLGSLSSTDESGKTTFRRVRKSTEDGYRGNVVTLKLFFRDKRLADIRLDHITQYETLRAAGDEPFVRYRRPQDAKPRVGPNGEELPPLGKTPCIAQPKQVNKEIGVLKRILKAGRVWGEEQDQCHQPLLEEESDIPRALTKEEQAHWLRVARSSARWETVYHYSALAFATCMSTNEIRSLRLSDIHLDAGYINIPWSGSKNKYRHRVVQIGTEGDDAYHAVQWLLNRASTLGANLPNHHLFPFRERSCRKGEKAGWGRRPSDFDPSRPMTVSGIKKLWDEVREASKLTYFRQYDTRHTAITRLAEEGIPIGVIMDEKRIRQQRQINSGCG